MEYDNISLDSLDSYDYAESSDNESENESLENNSDEQETEFENIQEKYQNLQQRINDNKQENKKQKEEIQKEILDITFSQDLNKINKKDISKEKETKENEEKKTLNKEDKKTLNKEDTKTLNNEDAKITNAKEKSEGSISVNYKEEIEVKKGLVIENIYENENSITNTMLIKNYQMKLLEGTISKFSPEILLLNCNNKVLMKGTIRKMEKNCASYKLDSETYLFVKTSFLKGFLSLENQVEREKNNHYLSTFHIYKKKKLYIIFSSSDPKMLEKQELEEEIQTLMKKAYNETQDLDVVNVTVHCLEKFSSHESFKLELRVDNEVKDVNLKKNWHNKKETISNYIVNLGNYKYSIYEEEFNNCFLKITHSEKEKIEEKKIQMLENYNKSLEELKHDLENEKQKEKQQQIERKIESAKLKIKTLESIKIDNFENLFMNDNEDDGISLEVERDKIK